VNKHVSAEIPELEAALEYDFKTPALLIEALTHRSYRHEHPKESAADNERLEFLGDSVLGLAVVDYLYSMTGEYDESVMSKVKSYIVRRTVLSEVAKELSLGAYLRLGRGEEDTGGRKKMSILSCAMEAVIGAVYVDGGLPEAMGLIERIFKNRIERAVRSGDYKDYKTDLQEETQTIFGVLPEYRIARQEGSEHQKVFTVEVFISGNLRGVGTGRSKKEAQSKAAREALKSLHADPGKVVD